MSLIPPIKYHTYHSGDEKYGCVVANIHACENKSEGLEDSYVVEVYCRKGGQSGSHKIFKDCFYETSFFDYWVYVGDTGWDAEEEYRLQTSQDTNNKVNANA